MTGMRAFCRVFNASLGDRLLPWGCGSLPRARSFDTLANRTASLLRYICPDTGVLPCEGTLVKFRGVVAQPQEWNEALDDRGGVVYVEGYKSNGASFLISTSLCCY